MPKLFGPDNPQFTLGRNDENTGWVRVAGEPVFTEARTLGEAIFAYERAFSVSITPYDGSFPEVPFAPDEEPKYFVMRWRNSDQTSLVDIHITRDGFTLCPKQDLNYKLETADVLEIGSLVC